MSEQLKREFLELLEKDREFRYAVAGYLGLSELMKRMDRAWAAMVKLWREVRRMREEQRKLWENQERLWANQEKLWEEVRALRENHEKLWIEAKALREDQGKLRADVEALKKGQERLQADIEALKEGQEKLRAEVEALREGQERLRADVEALKEGQEKLRIDVEALREGQDRLRADVEALKEGQGRLWDSYVNLSGRVDRLEKYVRSGFEGLRRALRYTFEDFASGFVKILLEDMGYPGARVEKGYIVREGRVTEVDILCEDPLVVGEVTLKVETPEEAEAEVAKLLERAEAAKQAYGREPLLKILCVARAEPAAAQTLKERAAAHGIKLAMGEEIGWQ